MDKDLLIQDLKGELISPYSVQELECRVPLYPYQMDNNIYINLKNNLIRMIEGKCNKYGYIQKIYKITDYSTGNLEPENLSGSAIYNIKYLANVCIAITKSKIIVKIDKLANDLILGINGPIKCIIKLRDINNNIFNITNGNSVQHKESNKILTINDYIKITIMSHAFHAGEISVPVMGYIDDIPTIEEIKTYFNSSNINNIEIDDKIESFELNEDKTS